MGGALTYKKGDKRDGGVVVILYGAIDVVLCRLMHARTTCWSAAALMYVMPPSLQPGPHYPIDFTSRLSCRPTANRNVKHDCPTDCPLVALRLSFLVLSAFFPQRFG